MARAAHGRQRLAWLVSRARQDALSSAIAMRHRSCDKNHGENHSVQGSTREAYMHVHGARTCTGISILTILQNLHVGALRQRPVCVALSHEHTLPPFPPPPYPPTSVRSNMVSDTKFPLWHLTNSLVPPPPAGATSPENLSAPEPRSSTMSLAACSTLPSCTSPRNSRSTLGA